jgi:tetratricopeptide (TPR) repeat protein
MPAFAAIHDAAALHEAFADLPPTDDPPSLAARAGYEALNDLALGHWAMLLDKKAIFAGNLTKLPYSFVFNPRSFQPAVAYALALSGDFANADIEIDKTPTDCSVCLRMRGRIDTLEKNWSGATYWFTRAANDAPSTPFPFTDWGQMLLDKGEYDAAIAQFIIANRKGPRFADPLEMWGEALMAKNQSHLALAKFAEAEKCAPNWGRLHLKWGEALYYAGDRDEAKAQFARAAQLDLTPAEKSELARSHAVATNP